MSSSLDLVRQAFGSSLVPLVVMIVSAVAMAVCRQAAAARLKRGHGTNWQRGSFNLFAMLLAISGVILVYDRVTAASNARVEAAAAEARSDQQHRDDEYERQLSAVRAGAVQQSIHALTQQGRGFQINSTSGTTTPGGQTNR